MPIRNFKILFIWILVVFSTATAFSQTKEIDSLKLVLANAKEDTNKVNALIAIGWKYHINYEFSSAIKYADSALRIAKKIQFVPGEYDALNILGTTYKRQYNTAQALSYFSAALLLGKETGNKKMMAESYINISKSYLYQQNFPEALRNSFIALRLFDEIGNKYNIALAWLNTGMVYSRQGNQQEAGNSYSRALKLYKESPETQKEDLARCYHFIGRSNLLEGNYSIAMNLFLAALKIWQETGDKSFIAGTTSHIGHAYKGLGDSALEKGDKITAAKMYNECLKTYQKSFLLWEALGDVASKSSTNKSLGDIFILLKKFPQARDHLNKALQLQKLANQKDSYQEIYQSLFKLDSIEGNYRLALEHYKLSIIYNDSMFNEQSTRKAEGYKLQYNFDKKEDSLKQKQFITETKLKTEKEQKYFYWIGIAMLALLSFFAFLSFRNQQKINRLAAETHAKEKVELELQTLRAQLNPHFIFNCISSIDGLIQNNEKYDATNYLNKFAKLMRNVLEDSKEDSVSFSNDIETLKLYLDLEQLRNEDKYSTQLIVPDELLNSNYIVPPLVIQPFVENAIKHGLKNKPGKNGLLKIEVKQVEDHLQYIISDNGIGRQATADSETMTIDHMDHK